MSAAAGCCRLRQSSPLRSSVHRPAPMLAPLRLTMASAPSSASVQEPLAVRPSHCAVSTPGASPPP